jgi:hypothetical protein
MSGTIVLDTPEQIEAARLFTIRSGLKLEITTGMQMSRGVSMLKIANLAMGTNYRVKTVAYMALNERIVKQLGEKFSRPL